MSLPTPRQLVATIVSSPQNLCLDEALIRKIRSAIPESKVEVLAENHAVDFYFESICANKRLGEKIREKTMDDPVDIVVQSPEARKKRLLLADMDSTMIEQECIDELADMVGLKEKVSAITEKAMRGEIAFEPALKERVALLKGLPENIASELLEKKITLMKGARELVQTMRRNGAYAALVSGGFTIFTGPIATKIGFQFHRSNVLLIEDGKFDGNVKEPILGREAKRETLLELRDKFDLQPEEVLAVGDGANDLAMLQEAGLGVAYHAKPIVAEAAHASINYGDLTTLLYFQGYNRQEIYA